MPHPQRHSRLSPSLILLAMLLGLLPAGAQQQQQPASSGDNGAVNLFFTVTDKTGRAIPSLRKEDIRVLEDGQPQAIAGFTTQTEQPLAIVVMLDMSVSQEKMIPIAKSASLEFVGSIIRQGKDSVCVVTFTHEAKLEQELTTSLEQVRHAIERVKFQTPVGYSKGILVIGPPPKRKPKQVFPGSTAIWDAVGFASENVSLRSSADTRRVLILFTDGEDTSSRLKLNEAAERAIKSGVAVYSVAISDQYFGGASESDLRKISERTGGRAYFPKKVKDLREVLAGIEQELRFQYLVSYSSTGVKAPDKMRKIKIELVNPELRKQGLQLSYQQGYFTR